ncbi:hypothetical protein, partial [Oscillibacter sp. CU971]|uniref:hypothetical protein n=1 Tax=Oscillibacter sp. CU971 TaxID=2780102 RepID=UPI00195E5DEA
VIINARTRDRNFFIEHSSFKDYGPLELTMPPPGFVSGLADPTSSLELASSARRPQMQSIRKKKP